MAFVCKELSNTNLSLPDNTCKEWEVLEIQQTSILPELTASDRDSILFWMISIFAVVFVVKRLRRFLGA